MTITKEIIFGVLAGAAVVFICLVIFKKKKIL